MQRSVTPVRIEMWMIGWPLVVAGGLTCSTETDSFELNHFEMSVAIF
ncbi:MAG TPA: hypothetical protein VIH72_12110 [Candidatus Acidoferrales bacterium]